MNRTIKSLTAALAFVATTLAGTSGIAKAADPVPANVVITVPANVAIDESPGQSWVDFHRVSDHGMYTGTIETAVKGIDIGAMGNHRAESRGNRQFVANGVQPGDYLLVGHFGANMVIGTIHSVAEGPQYGQSQTDKLTWSSGTTGTTSTTGANKAGSSAAAKAKPRLVVAKTPLCVAVQPVAKTGGVAYLRSGGPFTGTVVLVLSTETSVLSLEAAQAMYAADGDNAVEVDFRGVAVGETVEVASGAYQAFNKVGGTLTPLGFLNANPVTMPTSVRTPQQAEAWKKSKAVDGLTRPYATCERVKPELLAADPARAGFDDDLPGGLAAIAAGAFMLLGAYFARSRRQAAKLVAC